MKKKKKIFFATDNDNLFVYGRIKKVFNRGYLGTGKNKRKGRKKEKEWD